MKLKVKLLSIFREHAREDANGLTEIPDGATVEVLAQSLGLPMKLVRIITINGKQADLEDRLSDGDLVYLFPPALGGG